jgi:hypothetical protein
MKLQDKPLIALTAEELMSREVLESGEKAGLAPSQQMNR